ncbi:DUF5011 domain-containing protein [Pycnococcus provasolii]
MALRTLAFALAASSPCVLGQAQEAGSAALSAPSLTLSHSADEGVLIAKLNTPQATSAKLALKPYSGGNQNVATAVVVTQCGAGGDGAAGEPCEGEASFGGVDADDSLKLQRGTMYTVTATVGEDETSVLSATASIPAGDDETPKPSVQTPIVKGVTPSGDAVHVSAAAGDEMHASVTAGLFQPSAKPTVEQVARGICGATANAKPNEAMRLPLHQPVGEKGERAAATNAASLGCCLPGKPCAAFAVALDANKNPIGDVRRADGSFFYPRSKQHGALPIVDNVEAVDIDETGMVVGIMPRVPADVAFVVCHQQDAHGTAPQEVRAGRCARSQKAVARGVMRVPPTDAGAHAFATARVDMPLKGWAKRSPVQVVAVPAKAPKTGEDACPGSDGAAARCDEPVLMPAPVVLRDLTPPLITDVVMSDVGDHALKLTVTLDEPGTAYYAIVERARRSDPPLDRMPTFEELRSREIQGAGKVQYGAIRAAPVMPFHGSTGVEGALLSAWRALGAFRRRLMSVDGAEETSSGSAHVSGLTEGHMHDVYVAAEDEFKNVQRRKLATRRVLTNDGVGPVITITGNNPETLESMSGAFDVTNTASTAYNTYTDAGATATDTGDGGSTTVTVTNPVNPAIPGRYEVVYTSADQYGTTTTETRVVNVVTTTNGWAPIIYGQGNQLNHEYPGRFYADSCCEWRKRCLVTDILYFCTDDEVTACNAITEANRDPKCFMCSMCDANGGSPTGQSSIVPVTNKPVTMADFQKEACHPKPVFDTSLKTQLGERVGWSSYLDPDTQSYRGAKGSLGVVDQFRRFGATSAATINDIPACPNCPYIQAPKFTVCGNIEYICTKFQDQTTKQCLPLANPADLNPTTEDQIAAVRQNIGAKQKHLDEKLQRLFTSFFHGRKLRKLT